MLRYAVLSAGGWVWYRLQPCMANFEVLQMLLLLHAFISAYLLARARAFMHLFILILRSLSLSMLSNVTNLTPIDSWHFSAKYELELNA